MARFHVFPLPARFFSPPFSLIDRLSASMPSAIMSTGLWLACCLLLAMAEIWAQPELLPPPIEEMTSVPALVEVLRDGDEVQRARAAARLGVLADADALGALMDILRDRSAQVRAEAAGALGKIGDERALDVLIEAVADEAVPVGMKAVGAHGRFRAPRASDALLALLNDPQSPLRALAALSLGVQGEPYAARPLLALLTADDAALREAAAEALGTISPADPLITDALIARLRDERWMVRRAAVIALEERGDRKASQALAERLTDQHATVRLAAIRALQTLQGEMAVETVIALLPEYPLLPKARISEGARDDFLIGALAAIGDPRAVEPLIAALDYGNIWNRQAAARALGKLGDQRAILPLIAAVEHFGSDIRLTAVMALQAITGQDFGEDAAQWRR